MMIKSITCESVSSRLKENYNLSYQSIDTLNSVVVTIVLENNIQLLGEVTPLVGYNDENVEKVLSQLNDAIKSIKNICISDAIAKLEKIITAKNAFALSALIPPLENYLEQETLNSFQYRTSDFIYSLDYNNIKELSLAKELNIIKEKGFSTIKVKFGKELNKELKFIEDLSKLNLEGLVFRFDANGGYNFKESVLVLKKLLKIATYVEYLEQPVCKSCWDDMNELFILNMHINIMIDESIFTKEDIKKSYEIGAKYIKIKLCKFGSLKALKDALDYAYDLGLKIVFGNGVATDIANYFEILFFMQNKTKIYGAIESVGFLKTQNFIYYNLVKDFKDV